MKCNEELYREIILDHNKHPRNCGPLPETTHEASGINDNCGDQLTVRAHIKNYFAKKIMFEGDGCALCKVSASLMTTALQGHFLNNIYLKIQLIEELLLSESDPDSETLEEIGDIAALMGVRQYPQRVKCVLLAWDVLKKALSEPFK